jgi:hypothetical protein
MSQSLYLSQFAYSDIRSHGGSSIFGANMVACLAYSPYCERDTKHKILNFTSKHNNEQNVCF